MQIAQSGRLLLAVGLPIALAGSAGIAVGFGVECYQPNDRADGALVTGLAIGSIGVGLSAEPISSL